MILTLDEPLDIQVWRRGVPGQNQWLVAADKIIWIIRLHANCEGC